MLLVADKKSRTFLQFPIFS